MKYISIILLFMILTGCSSSYKELNKNTYTSQDPFITTIIEEYKVNADFEANKMHDWNSVKLYSKKAIKASNGEKIKPEPMSNWKIPGNKILELTKAYDNLMITYEEALKNNPINLAKAIVALDCWAEQQEEGWQIDHIDDCKSKYLKAMHLVYKNITLNKQEVYEQNNSAIILTKNKEPDKIIYFDFDKFKLNTENVNEIKKYIYDNGTDKYEYLIIGHTDTKGTKIYNYELSIQRANSIKNLLNKLGVNLNKIRVVGKGEERLAVPTPDEIPHPANRRAVIKASY